MTTSIPRAPTRYLQIGRAVLPPYAECRSNHEVICALAEAARRAAIPAFAMSAFEMIEHTLARQRPARRRSIRGRRLARLLARPSRPAIFSTALAIADKKFHFRADWQAIGPEHAHCPPFPDHVAVIDDGDPEQPFRLVAGAVALVPQHQLQQHARRASPARAGRPRSSIREALAELGLGDGDRVRIGNRRGSVVVHARAFDGLQKRVVIVEGLWPNHAFEEGIGINLLTSADPGLPRGGAVFHDTSVWLRPA